MRIAVSLCFVVLLAVRLPSSEVAEHSSIVEPGTVGLDAAKLAGIDELMRAEVEAGRIVGCLALVARGDKIAYVKMWGDRNREDGKPMAADTIFRIYSMSKPITSVAAMQLVEHGKMNLDDALSKYLPAIENVQVLTKEGDETKEVPAERSISVRDLLRHSLIGIYMIQINPYQGREYGSEMKKIVYAADTQASPAENATTAPMP